MSGPAGVLCLHGLLGSPSELRPLVESLEREGRVVEAPLLAGHGGDTVALRASTREDWLATAHGELGALVLRTGSSVAVVGGGMGALLALDLAVSHADMVAALVLIAPPPEPNAFQRARLAMRRRRAGRALAAPDLASGMAPDLTFTGPATPPDVSDPGARFQLPPLVRCPLETAEEYGCLARESLRLVSEVRQPVLVAHGRLDRTVSRRHVEALVRQLRAVTTVETEWLDQSAHLVAADRQRAAFGARVEAFLKAH